MFDVYDTAIRCGVNAEKGSLSSEILVVNAGDELSAGVWSSPSNQITHGGPGMFYLAKAPDGVDLRTWDGNGDWFKIGELGWNTNTKAGWLADVEPHSMNVTIPKTTPPGKYLLRIEHLFLRTEIKETNFFVSCAQLDIKGNGGGTPSPTVKFPGAYDDFDEGIWAPLWTQGYWLKGYIPPGPPVWTG
ncbi:uncharacterized protein BDR25DRAFT_298586 [Lindgomyces ingoldianus]|uniref:Uncharacterized protein n=1 Tax=Lindgomyces ingoldianus TaxID=673940 RepID=A0ACB6QA76_9PLEO|nr:uncharacterized protein BDR25DRAFT_298586 [Lindgomyces ingoldianus]KAF2463055.1 hypothetical protein BDR25DRAFT_298586 [Lindgomyces ingoldianus]